MTRFELMAIVYMAAGGVIVPAKRSAADTPPSNGRSRKAIARVAPNLRSQLAEQGLEYGAPVFMRIFKETAELELWVKRDSQFVLFKTYDICYFSGKLGPKRQVGDLQSPEGFYAVGPRQMNPASSFHLSFNLGYPNAYDRAHARTGSALMVHGDCVSIGCYAMTNEKIEEIYALADAALRKGQPFFRVHAFPFRMSNDRLEREKESPWYDFWTNLKTGYDFFERRKIPPNVEVTERHYVFD